MQQYQGQGQVCRSAAKYGNRAELSSWWPFWPPPQLGHWIQQFGAHKMGFMMHTSQISSQKHVFSAISRPFFFIFFQKIAIQWQFWPLCVWPQPPQQPQCIGAWHWGPWWAAMNFFRACPHIDTSCIGPFIGACTVGAITQELSEIGEILAHFSIGNFQKESKTMAFKA